MKNVNCNHATFMRQAKTFLKFVIKLNNFNIISEIVNFKNTYRHGFNRLAKKVANYHVSSPCKTYSVF